MFMVSDISNPIYLANSPIIAMKGKACVIVAQIVTWRCLQIRYSRKLSVEAIAVTKLSIISIQLGWGREILMLREEMESELNSID